MLLGLGDNCLDIFVDDGTAYPGGNAVNVAVFARQLAHETHYAGRFGAEIGRYLLQEIAAAGVGVDACRIESGETTAWTWIGVRDGERMFLSAHHGPAGPFRLDERQRALAARADVIHTSVYSRLPADECAGLRRPGCLISLDASTRGAEEVRPLLPLVGIAFFSAPFESAETHAADAARIAALGPGRVVIGHGDRGATFHEQGRSWRQGIAPARVVDTLGAGDAFIARILIGLMEGETLAAAGKAASAFAAKACERRGAFGRPLELDPGSAAVMIAGQLFAEGFKEAPYWWEDAPPQSFRSQKLPDGSDVVVVGSGYAGLNAAITLARSGVEVTLVEAGRFGEGASTRNGGQLLARPRPSSKQLATRYGDIRAREILDDFSWAPDFVRERIAQFGIDCHAEWNGLLIGAHSRRKFEAMAQSVGPGMRVVAEPDLGAEIRTGIYRGGVVLQDGGQIHPALYHAGLLAAAKAVGVKLNACVPAQGLRPLTQGGVEVVVEGGAIRARRVIVATNGYTCAVDPWLKRRLIPIRSYMIATEALPDADIRSLLTGDRAVADTKGVLYYFRASPDRRRILFGGPRQFPRY